MQSVSRSYPQVRSRRSRKSFRLPDGPLLFGLSLAFYLVTASVLVLRYQAVVPEALSRVGNAYYVLFSRDPHLAAIGFVWNPLPSLLTLTVLPLKALWPALAQLGFAGNVVSALFMAGAVYQAYALLREFGVSRRWRLVLTLLFALQPLFLYVGATGLPQPIILFCALLAIRRLGAWVSTGQLRPLIAAGTSIACAYLVTTSALAAAAGAVLLISTISFRRSTDRGSERVLTAACDAIIFALPLVLAVFAWTAATWLITGDPFHQLSSIYATGSQVNALATQPAQLLPAVSRLLVLAPGLPAIVGLAVFGLIRWRNPRLMAGLALCLPVLAFEVLSESTGTSLPSLISFVVVIPLILVLVAAASTAEWPPLQRAIGSLILLAALPASAAGLLDARIAPQEAPVIRPVAAALLTGREPAPAADPLASARMVATWLDNHRLASGSVLLDSYTGFPVVLASNDPRQFVITSDRDFRLALTDPAGNGVQYLLVPAPTNAVSISALDALARAYPGLYENGGGIATLTEDFVDGAGHPTWRLYRVLSN